MLDTNAQAALVRKYDVPVPRYTSYPTVPHWNLEGFSVDQWSAGVRKAFDESNGRKGISLYLHLPFCESLCTYCACNTRITRNHGVEVDYVRTMLKEWSLYQRLFSERATVRELHLGGGTPTFFSARNLHWLLSYLLEEADIHPDRKFSFEGHPNNTTDDHLKVLHSLGFTRVSFGVQDLDMRVQRAINRIQPFENLARVTEQSRARGYTSISFDLIYGLPFQTRKSVTDTIKKVIALRPDRISFYSYAHVPWLRPGQRGYENADLPTDVEKLELYETGRDLLIDCGYHDVGMDHFALSHDALYKAREDGTLHRNFMGYTTTETDLLIGLGASAISDARYGYAQNVKKVEEYHALTRTDVLPIAKGHIQSEMDMEIRKAILDVACQGRISQQTLASTGYDEVMASLLEFERDGLLERNFDGFCVTKEGRHFIRNICSVFDHYFQRVAKSSDVSRQIFSRAI